MANPNITNWTSNGLVIAGPVYGDVTATVTGAETWPQGAVLGKVTASGKYVRYASGASDGSQIPMAVVDAPAVFTASGDKVVRVLISGQVRQGKLVDAVGGALTAAAIDSLRDYTIIARPVTQLAIQDNQ
jgi:hypothetical protein